MSLVGLDVGDRTIGVATSEGATFGAFALGTVWRKGDRQDFPALVKMLDGREADRFVVGWPLNMDGSEGPRALKTRRFAQRLKVHFDRPVLLWDERLSTFDARQKLLERGIPRERQKEMIDALAAEVILQSYLDAGAPVTGEEP